MTFLVVVMALMLVLAMLMVHRGCTLVDNGISILN
jgi:hypothetical protein